MKEYELTLSATYTINIQAENQEEAFEKAAETIESSKVYHEGAEFEDGIIWFAKIEELYISNINDINQD